MINVNFVRSFQRLLLIAAPTVALLAATNDTKAQTRDTNTSTADLVRRLEAMEAELCKLRQRNAERSAWERSVLCRLPAIDANHGISTVAFDELPPSTCQCGHCGDAKPICQGVGPLCERCKEQLSWNKGQWRIIPFGFLTGEAIGVSSNTVSRPMILYLASDSAGDNEQFTVHGQTTALGFNFGGPRVGSFQLGGMILFNFLGDRPALNQATPFFLRGYGELRNEDWRFTFGQQGDLFNPLDPVTVNFGGHKQAGNGGSFRGSFRAERFIRPSDHVQWTLQSAISQQVVTDFTIDPRIVGTDNGWPNIEGRVGLGLGPATGGSRPVELGVSGIVGETRAFGLLGEGIYTTWGISTDAQFGAERWGVRGEFFVGQALGTYNLGIGQSLDPTGFRPIRSVGGWADAWYKLTCALTLHVGYGIDDPRNSDVGQFLDDNLNPVAGQRSLNQVVWTNLIWEVSEYFDMGFEVSHRKSDYIAPSISNDAMVYHFRSRLKF